MAGYRISDEAYQDLKQIFKYSIEKFGRKQAKNYSQELILCFSKISTFVEIGKTPIKINSNLRYFCFKSHIVFYEARLSEIVIVRVLGNQMDVKKHL
jgi:toxin ParE1/3/4